MLVNILALLSLIGLGASQDTSLVAVKSAFEAASASLTSPLHRIYWVTDSAQIPSDLSITFNPRFLLEVALPQPTGHPITLHAGVQLPRNATAGPPSFSVIGNIGRGPFVIATVDPDAPTPQAPTNAQIRHFLAPNFFAEGRLFPPVHILVNETAAISPFLQPTPPAGSDAHRYIFLLFNQPADFNRQTLVTSTTPTSLFNISEFAAATGLGNPIAGTFMRVAPDPTAA